MISLIAESMVKDLAPLFDFITSIGALGDVAGDSNEF